MLASSNQQGYPRLGLAIAKKNIRLATDRNRIKRIIRESFRTGRQAMSACDFVIMAKYPAASVDNVKLFESLARHWQSIRIP